MITLQFLLAALVVVLAPGTGVIYTLALGLGQGWRAAFWAVFMAMTFAIFLLYGVFAAAARTWPWGSEVVMRWLNRSFAAIFAALAGRFALERA